MTWRSYRDKYGSLFFGRRLEQSFGNWMALYSRFKVKEGTSINAFDFMPHEESKMQKDEVTLEDYMESLCGE